MSLFYNACYLALLAVVWPWLLYRAVGQGKYRAGWSEKLWGSVPRRDGDGVCLWFHAVSVGEVNLIAPLVAEIRRRRPDCDCVVSTTTATGFAVAGKRYPELTVFYCPLDFSWAVRRAMDRVRPTCLVLAELELWPNLVAAARSSGASVAVVNGRLSERSFRGYGRIAPLIASTLARIDLIAAQDAVSAERFRRLGASRPAVHVTGSLKFDGAETNRANEATRRLCALAGVQDGDIVFLAGSTQEPEEAAALEAYRALAPEHPRLRLIVAPRHPERFAAVADLLDRSGVCWQRRSRLESDGPDGRARVLLVDAMGELGAWWGAARIAFVGGSLGKRGGQNMIEPAAYGAAVSFGPNTRNFREIVAMLLAANAAEVIADAVQLTAFVRRCVDDPAYARTLGANASQLVAGQLGATCRTFDLLLPLIERGAAAESTGRAAA